jgi:hypothetical protein|tara:strand:- start:524 stop:967 length:444 start_codon:yes stop_codon:yes gene_type:complete
MIKYQQGDVVFIAINTDEWIIEEKPMGKVMARTDGGGKLIGNEEKETQQVNSDWNNKDNVMTVAHGEATGHSHSFNMVDHDPGIGVTAFGSYSTRVGSVPKYVHIEGGSATIKHEEHNPLTIPPGHYKVRIVREFDHISRTTRSVMD